MQELCNHENKRPPASGRKAHKAHVADLNRRDSWIKHLRKRTLYPAADRDDPIEVIEIQFPAHISIPPPGELLRISEQLPQAPKINEYTPGAGHRPACGRDARIPFSCRCRLTYVVSGNRLLEVLQFTFSIHFIRYIFTCGKVIKSY
jgi:hypothetical protein